AFGTDRGGDGARAGTGPTPADDHPAAGAARDHSAADQPIPEPDEELVTGGRDRVPGPGRRGEHVDEPDRTGDRSDRDPDGGVPRVQPRHLGADELVQRAHAVGRTVNWIRANLFS